MSLPNFNSYRRSNSLLATGRLFWCHLAEAGIFMDLEANSTRVGFTAAFDRLFNGCVFYLEMIGRHWLTEPSAVASRLRTSRFCVVDEPGFVSESSGRY